MQSEELPLVGGTGIEPLAPAVCRQHGRPSLFASLHA
jgi:hypothetical protein